MLNGTGDEPCSVELIKFLYARNSYVYDKSRYLYYEIPRHVRWLFTYLTTLQSNLLDRHMSPVSELFG